MGLEVCVGFVRICILRAILFLAYPTYPPAHKVLLGGAWGGAGELMPLDDGGKRGLQERVVKQKLSK